LKCIWHSAEYPDLSNPVSGRIPDLKKGRIIRPTGLSSDCIPSRRKDLLPSDEEEDDDEGELETVSSEDEPVSWVELARENRSLHAQLDRYVDHDRELLRRERRQLEDYRPAVVRIGVRYQRKP
jgi:hypothetical protein